eukprot:7098800-Pyramimonas_sp.AAC.1
MGNARLALRSHRLPSSGAWAPNCLITGTRAPMCSDVTGQVRARQLLQQDVLRSITYPRRHTVVRSTFDVTDKAEKIHVLLSCPFGNATGRVARGAEQAASSHSCTVKDLHRDFRRYGRSTPDWVGGPGSLGLAAAASRP